MHLHLFCYSLSYIQAHNAVLLNFDQYALEIFWQSPCDTQKTLSEGIINAFQDAC